jgi:hypothetical protein
MMYQAISANDFITQGVVVDECPIFDVESVSEKLAEGTEVPISLARVVILTQACDLAQVKTSRILVALVHSAESLDAKGILKPATIRDQIRRSLVYGWYFLPAAREPIPFPESIVDLRDLHTTSRLVLERLISEGKGVCRIESPYREHLAQHFAVTYSRIGLPEPYGTQT